MGEVILEGQEVYVHSGSRQGGLVTSSSESWRGNHSSFPNQPQSGAAAGPLSRFLLYGLAVAALVVAVKGFLSKNSTTEEADMEERGSQLQSATLSRADRAGATGSAGVTQRSMSEEAGGDGPASGARAAAAMDDRHRVLQEPRAAEQSTPKKQVGESRQVAEEGGRSLEQASSQAQLAEKQQKLEELAAQLERAVRKSKEVESLQLKAVEAREQADLAAKRATENLQKLEVSHAALAAQAEELQGKLQAASQEKKEEAARRATLEDDERKKANEVNRLQQAVQEMEGRLSETSQQLGAAKRESEDVRAKLEAQLEEVAGQVAALKRQGKEASDAEEQLISQMEREHEDEMGSLKAVAAVEKRVLEEQVEELKRKLKKAARPGAAAADSMETLQREMDEKQQQLSVTRELVEHYMKVDKERDQRIVELERRIAGSQELVDDLRRSVEAAAASSLVKVLEPEGDAREDLDLLREHMEQSEAGHREEVKGLLSQLDASQSLAKKLEAQIHEAKEMLASEKVRSKEAAGKVDTMVLQSKELASAVQMAKELERRADQVEGRLKTRESELLKALEEREQKVTQAQEEVESLKTAVDKERQMRLASQAKVGVSDDVLRPVVEENKRLKEELAQARAGVAAAESENQKLARDLEGVSTRLREAEDVKLKNQLASAAEADEARERAQQREQAAAQAREARTELQKAMSLLKKRDSTIEEMKAETTRTAKQMEQLKSEAAKALAAKQRGAAELERVRAEVHEARAKLTAREEAGTELKKAMSLLKKRDSTIEEMKAEAVRTAKQMEQLKSEAAEALAAKQRGAAELENVRAEVHDARAKLTARAEAGTELKKAMSLLKKRDSTIEEMKAESVRTAKQMEQLKSEAAEALAAKQQGAAELERVRAEVHEARAKLTAREEAGNELQKAMSLLKKRDSTIEEMKAEAIRTAKQLEQLKSEAAEALVAKQRGAAELERVRAEVHEARAKLTIREPDQAGTVGSLQPSESTVSLTELVLRHRGMLADAEQAFNQALGTGVYQPIFTDITPSPDAWELLGDVEALREQLSLLEDRLQSALEAQVIQAQQHEQELEANLSVMKQREADLVSQLEQARALSEEQADLSARQEMERQEDDQGAHEVQQTLTALQSQLAELKAQYDVQGGQLKLFKRQADSVLKERDEVTEALKQQHQQEIAQLKEKLMQEFRRTPEAPREVLEEGAGEQWTKELEHEAARLSTQEPGSRNARSITRPELKKGPADEAAASTQALSGLDERLRAAENKAEQLATEVRQRVTRQMEWTGGPTELRKSDGNGSYNSKGDVQRAQEIKERVAAMWQEMLSKNSTRDP
eukprot:SM000216S06555  [mRNA]  locus=s216:54117:59200:- [translate_table: standard]